jgi:hypothetical protein
MLHEIAAVIADEFGAGPQVDVKTISTSSSTCPPSIAADSAEGVP